MRNMIEPTLNRNPTPTPTPIPAPTPTPNQVDAVRNMIEPILRYLSAHPPLSITPGERRAEHDRADPQRPPADAAAGCVRGGKHRYLVITPMATAAGRVRGGGRAGTLTLTLTPTPTSPFTVTAHRSPLTFHPNPHPHPHPKQVGELARDAIGDEAFDKLVEVDRYTP